MFQHDQCSMNRKCDYLSIVVDDDREEDLCIFWQNSYVIIEWRQTVDVDYEELVHICVCHLQYNDFPFCFVFLNDYSTS